MRISKVFRYRILEKFNYNVIMNGTGHNSVLSTWRTMEIFAIPKADIMRNTASNSESDGSKIEEAIER